MSDVNLNDPAFKPENEDPRRRNAPRARSILPQSKSEKLVKLVCITETKPWVVIREEGKPDLEKPLDHGETAETLEWIADILVNNKHAVRV